MRESNNAKIYSLNVIVLLTLISIVSHNFTYYDKKMKLLRPRVFSVPYEHNKKPSIKKMKQNDQAAQEYLRQMLNKNKNETDYLTN